LHDYRDPLFGGGMPEPKPEFLKELIALVKQEKLDVGLATDGDADRFAIIDENRRLSFSQSMLCLLTRHLFKNRGIKGASSARLEPHICWTSRQNSTDWN